jgi:hypothetical protein
VLLDVLTVLLDRRAFETVRFRGFNPTLPDIFDCKSRSNNPSLKRPVGSVAPE